MLYLNSRPQTVQTSTTPPTYIRPAANHARRGPETFYQWRNFYDETPEAESAIDASYAEEKSETRQDKYFLLPGRKNTITRMVDNNSIDVRRMIGTHGPIEEWERSVKTTFPIKRSFAAMIGQYAPRLRGSISSVTDPAAITESWSRKSKFFKTHKSRRLMRRGDVQAELSSVKVEGTRHKSIALISDRPEALLEEIARLGLKPKANTHFGTFLMHG